MKKFFLFSSLLLLSVNHVNAAELACPIIGDGTVTVTGADTVSASCGISTEQDFLDGAPVATLQVGSGGSLAVGATGTLRNHGNLNTLAGGNLINDGTLRNGDTPESYFASSSGPPAGTIINNGVLTNNGLLTNNNGFTVYTGSSNIDLPESEIINNGSLVNNGIFNNGQLKQYYCGGFPPCAEEYVAKITNTGQISNASSATFNNYGVLRNLGTFANAGLLELHDSSYVYGSGTLSNLTAGTINNDGTLAAATLHNDGAMLNTGAAEVGTISGSGDYTQGRGWTYAFGAVDQGSISILSGSLLGDGSITTGRLIIGQSGRIEVGSGVEAFEPACWEGGYCDQATGIGQLDIFGDVDMAGALEVRVGIDGYASLFVDGVLDLNGADFVLVEDLDWYGDEYDLTLQIGDSFDLVTAAAINGEFATVRLFGLDNNLAWRTQYVTENGSEIFRATVVPVPAAVWLFASALGLLGWRRRTSCWLRSDCAALAA